MPHSVCNIYLHLVFGIKTHYTPIKADWETKLYSYMSGIIINLGGNVVIINGVEDHVHILCTLPKDLSISVLMREIKANSSKWIHHSYNPKFAWQEGYGAFSVGMNNLEQVKNYISNQKIHHNRKAWQQEYDDLLRACGIDPIYKVIE